MENITLTDGLAAISAFGILLLVADKITDYHVVEFTDHRPTFIKHFLSAWAEYLPNAMQIFGLLFISMYTISIIGRSPIIYSGNVINGRDFIMMPITLVFNLVMCLTLYRHVMKIKNINNVNSNDNEFILLLFASLPPSDHTSSLHLFLQFLMWNLWYLGIVYQFSHIEENSLKVQMCRSLYGWLLPGFL